jgi:hypothetical protein
MKTVTLELPDKIAVIFEKLPLSRKTNAALLTAAFASASPKTADRLFDAVDKRVATSGLSENEIDGLLEDLS